MSADSDATAQRRYCLFPTALGMLGMAWSGQGLTRFALPDADHSATERRLRHGGARICSDPPPELRSVIAAVRRYCAGERVDFSFVPLDLTGIDRFAASVYAALRAVPWGETTTYGALALMLEAPGASRAVGRALGLNPWPLIVPCHRVLAKDGPGGFSAFGGAATKDRLLALEGVTLVRQLAFDLA